MAQCSNSVLTLIQYDFSHDFTSPKWYQSMSHLNCHFQCWASNKLPRHWQFIQDVKLRILSGNL